MSVVRSAVQLRQKWGDDHMKSMPLNLLSLVLVGTGAGLYTLYRGTQADGADRWIWLSLGAVALAGVILVVLGWFRGPRGH